MNRQFKIADKIITDNSLPFVIAEIGHNHMGKLDHCKYLFKLAKECGCDAVKLQKRNNRELFTKTLFNEPYNSENSYGDTYGWHREALEFTYYQYYELKEYAKILDIIFFATAFDFKSADFLEALDLPAFKLCSADIVNTPLIEYVAEKDKPIIISTGGGTLNDIERAVSVLDIYSIDLALLHCVATYPNFAEELNLSFIKKLRERYPFIIIGFSSHYDGIDAAVNAYHYGAQIIEQHFTDSHLNKGSDHPLSLQPDGMKELIHRLRQAHKMKGEGKDNKIYERGKGPLRKMAKSVHVTKSLEVGHCLTSEDLTLKAPGDGLKPYELLNVLGKRLLFPMSTADILDESKIEKEDKYE